MQSLAPIGSALISAETMAGTLVGNLENSGTLMAERSLAITASGIENTGRVRTTGTDSSLILHAHRDLVHAGSIHGGRVELKADQDISMPASTREITGTTGNGTLLDRVATVAADTLDASAGRDFKLVASQIKTAGSASLTAARDVALETVSTGYRENLDHGRNYIHTSETGIVGARLDVGGSAELRAGGHFTATAASVTAVQDLKASAGGNLTLDSAHQTLSIDLGRYSSGSSFLSSWSEETRSLRETSVAAGNLFSGDRVVLQAGDNMMVQGSTVVGTRDVALDVAGNLEIKAATNSEHINSYSHTQESGMLSGGSFGVTFGKRTQKDEFDQRTITQSQSRSTVGAIDGDLSINAGHRAQVSGSDLVAGKDIKIVAKDAAIDPGLDQADRWERHEFRQTGLTLALGGGAMSCAQGIASHIQAAGETKGDARALALHALAAESQRENLAERMGSIQDAIASRDPREVAAASGVRIAVSIGTSQSVSESTERAQTHAGSILQARGNLSISATEGDLKIKGATLTSRDMTLEAVRDLELNSAVDQTSSRGSNSSSSASLGVSFGVGKRGGGFSVDVAASRGLGDSHGDSATHQDTLAAAQGTLTFRSGRDTKVLGAQASGQAIKGTVGGGLRVASRQDTFRYASTQKNIGVSASIPIGMGSGSASLNLSESKATGDSRSVRQQTGLMAGADGFQITVDGTTQLDGAVIASTADAGRNALTTRTLTVSDLENHATGSSTSSRLGVGTDMLESQIAKGLPRAGLGWGGANHSDASTSRNAVAPGTVTITDDQAQLALTGKSADQTVADLRRGTEGTHRALDRPDMASLEADAKSERDLMALAVDTAVTYSEKLPSARPKAPGASGKATVTGSGTVHPEEPGPGDPTPGLDPTVEKAKVEQEVPVSATITAPSEPGMAAAKARGSEAVDSGRSEPEAAADSIRSNGGSRRPLTLDLNSNIVQRPSAGDPADNSPRSIAMAAHFKANPTVRPGMEHLSEEAIQQQHVARVKHLESEIKTFKANIEKIRKAGA